MLEKPPMPSSLHAAFGTTAEHDILVAVTDAVEGIAHCVGAARTGGDRAGAHALEPGANGDLCRRHVGNAHGDEEGADALKAFLLAAGMLFLNDGQAADAAGYDDAAAGSSSGESGSTERPLSARASAAA